MNKEHKKKQIQVDEYKPADTSDLWIVPYADFLSVMMIFFLMMFCYASQAKEDNKFKEIVKSLQEEMGGKLNKELFKIKVDPKSKDEMIKELDEVIKRNSLNKLVTVIATNEQVNIVFANPVLFDSGKAELKPESQKILHELAQTLNQYNHEIIVEGHTDNVPIKGGKYRSNWELSVARSMAVIRYLVHKEGMFYKRFAAAGYGEYRPVYPNDTPEHRAQNRRIEINILRPADKTKKAEGDFSLPVDLSN